MSDVNEEQTFIFLLIIFCFTLTFATFTFAGYLPANSTPFSMIETHDVISRTNDVTSDHPTRSLRLPLDNFSGSTGGATTVSQTNLVSNSARLLACHWLLMASPR